MPDLALSRLPHRAGKIGSASRQREQTTADPRNQILRGDMSLRQSYATHAPLTLVDALVYYGEKVTHRALNTLAEMLFGYADAMLRAEANHG